MKTTRPISKPAAPRTVNRVSHATSRRGGSSASMPAAGSTNAPIVARKRGSSYAGYFALFLLFLALLVPLVTVVHLLPPPRPVPASRLGAIGPRHGETLEERVAWYFQSGQWRGDARTIAAMFRYLVTPEPAPANNQPGVHA